MEVLILSNFNAELKCILNTDESDFAIAVVLSQKEDHKIPQSIAYCW
jgi:hypothetical protein